MGSYVTLLNHIINKSILFFLFKKKKSILYKALNFIYIAHCIYKVVLVEKDNLQRDYTTNTESPANLSS